MCLKRVVINSSQTNSENTSTSDKNTALRTKPVLPRCLMTQTSLSHCWVIKEPTQPKSSLRQVFENMLLCPEHSFPKKGTQKGKSCQKLFSKQSMKKESAKVYTLETGYESSSGKDLHSFVKEERHFFKPKDN